MNELTVQLVSSASMDIFPEDTLVNFKNFFNEEISLERDWRVVLTENIFPTRINQVNSTRIIKYSSEGNKNHQRSISSGSVSKPYKVETVLINAGSYEILEHLIKTIKTATGLTKFSHQYNKIRVVLVLFFGSLGFALWFCSQHMNEPTVQLVSSASMDIFPEDTLVNFKNFFNEEISLEDDWRVVSSETIFPSRINQVNSTRIIKYSSEGNKNHQRSIQSGAVLKPYKRQTLLINAGSYENLENLMKTIKAATGLNKISHQYNKITGGLVLFFGKNEGITFPDKEIPSFLGFGGIKDDSSTHIGYRIIDSFNNFAKSDGEAKAFVADYPFDLLAGKQLIFVYSNIIEYQHIGDTKTPLLRFIGSKRRLKSGSFCEIEPTHRIVAFWNIRNCY